MYKWLGVVRLASLGHYDSMMAKVRFFVCYKNQLFRLFLCISNVFLGYFWQLFWLAESGVSVHFVHCESRGVFDVCILWCMVVTGEMDLSGGSVSADPNLTAARRNGTRDEHKHLYRIKAKRICSYFLKGTVHVKMKFHSRYRWVWGYLIYRFHVKFRPI